MAYEDLLRSVDESAQEKERELLSKAEAAVADIRSRAKAQAEAIRRGHIAESERSAAVERNRMLYLTRARNKELLIQVREEAFEKAFSEAKARLAGLRSSPEYAGVFERLVREAAGAMGGEDFTLHIDKRDDALCRKVCESLKIRAEVVPDLVTDGGIVASTGGDSVVISNTVESRLERARELKRTEIHAILSGE